MRPKAYSYIRFSTADQAKGDSLRRQLAASKDYAEAHGLELDDALTMRDLGISAYKGAHRTKGALGAFLKEVEAGAIAPGSVLLVESLDRLSREQVLDALQQFTGIIKAGIKVVTLADKMEYDVESINANFGQLLMSLVIMSRAHEESEIKAKRVSEAWVAKRAQAAAGGKKMTKRAPAWLLLSPDRSVYKVIEERAAAVRLIFEWKAIDIGSEAIVRKLNGDPEIWKPTENHSNRRGGWHKSYVEKIIRMRAVIGEHQPGRYVNGKRKDAGDPLLNYFPAIVKEDLFNRVQAILARNAAMPGRGGGTPGAVTNLFGPIARCARCGGTMTYVNKGRQQAAHYLRCDRARRGLGCDKTLIRYDRLEPLLLHFCRGLDARDLLTDEAQKVREEARLRHKAQALDGELDQTRKAIDSLAETIGRTTSRAMKGELEPRLEAKLRLRAKLEKARSKVKLDAAERGNTPEHIAENIADIEGLIERMNSLEGVERGELRRRLRHQLHKLLDRIEIKAQDDGTSLRLVFADGAQVGLLLDSAGGLRLVADEYRGVPVIYQLDGHGNVLAVDEDLDEAGRQKRVDRQKEVDKIVAKKVTQALRKRSIDLNMIV